MFDEELIFFDFEDSTVLFKFHSVSVSVVNDLQFQIFNLLQKNNPYEIFNQKSIVFYAY